MFPGHPDYILCKETQHDQNDVIDTSFPTQMVAIDLCCLLFLKEATHVGDPVPTVIEWTKFPSKAGTLPWLTHIQSMHWKEFRQAALVFLSQNCANLFPAMQKANNAKEIRWFGSISNIPRYQPPHGILLQGHLNFLGFGAAAYAAYPAEVKISLIMNNLCNDPSGNIKYSWTLAEDHIKVLALMLLAQSYKRTLASMANSGNVDELESSLDSCEMDLAVVAFPGNRFGTSEDLIDERVKHQRNNPITPLYSGSDIEFADLPKKLFSPELPDGLEDKTTNSRLLARVPRTPMGPPRRDMDQMSMKTFLWVANISDDDLETCKLLKKHQITHWSFFRSSDEDDLVSLGFAVGPARSLWEGVPRLEEYADEIKRTHDVATPSQINQMES
ncbi:hypothetical protein PtA15_13A513 [Puccinia triticina]|uniref:Uncharacterized protein n=1 Tax=Puccinia triticina TaxID=208348 RepID=A0ABY7D4C3_9BASI|nr:uncharacterized protein PtA15_13A513 [Puccinia triticina]WAQ91112.1 hypothetical protein PtA15_13A513 [Puccinia triticina]